jgi:hypothetical protein
MLSEIMLPLASQARVPFQLAIRLSPSAVVPVVPLPWPVQA